MARKLEKTGAKRVSNLRNAVWRTIFRKFGTISIRKLEPIARFKSGTCSHFLLWFLLAVVQGLPVQRKTSHQRRADPAGFLGDARRKGGAPVAVRQGSAYFCPLAARRLLAGALGAADPAVVLGVGWRVAKSAKLSEGSSMGPCTERLVMLLTISRTTP